MKKTIVILLSAALLLCLAACGGAGSSGASSQQSSGIAPAPQPNSTPEPELSSSSDVPEPDSGSDAQEPDSQPDTDSTGKTLVVYYSAAGSTKAVAEYIAAETGSDLFTVEPVEPYTSDDLNWTNRDSRVSREHDDPALRVMELAETVPADWDSYDTVFVGYPIWWGIAAWPVDAFIAANDFTGKTVIPFCTSTSSGLGESGRLLAEAAGTGDWQVGIRFQSRVSEEAVREWVQGLGL